MSEQMRKWKKEGKVGPGWGLGNESEKKK